MSAALILLVLTPRSEARVSFPLVVHREEPSFVIVHLKWCHAFEAEHHLDSHSYASRSVNLL